MSGRFAFAVPGSLTTPTGGYAYDRRVIAELAPLGWQADVIDLGSGFPRADAALRARACDRLCGLSGSWPVVVDGLALGVLPQAAAALAAGRALVALVHHPLALETGLAPAEAAALRESERAALAAARHVIVTSAATARLVAADYGVAASRITVAPPGTDPAPPAAVRPGRATVELLAVGALVPRKGYDVLLAALGRLADLPWRLTIAGDPTRNPQTAAALARQAAAGGLADRVTLAGAVTPAALARLYGAADLFVLASRHEGYGMAFAEAVAAGLPVVGTTAGAIAETVPPGAGVLVPPDDVAALAAALRRLIGDAGARGRLAAAARAAASGLPRWRETAQAFARVLGDLR